MKKFKIYYNHDGNGNKGIWSGEYQEINITENENNPKLKDVKVYIDTRLELELFGYDINSIDYNYIPDEILEEDDNDDNDDNDIFEKYLPWILAVVFMILFYLK
jgi:hypothetical protein